MGLETELGWQSPCPAGMKPWVYSPAPQTQNLEAQACNPSCGGRGSEIQGHLQPIYSRLYSLDFKAILGYSFSKLNNNEQVAGWVSPEVPEGSSLPDS